MDNLDLAKINKLLTKTIYNVIHVYVIKNTIEKIAYETMIIID